MNLNHHQDQQQAILWLADHLTPQVQSLFKEFGFSVVMAANWQDAYLLLMRKNFYALVVDSERDKDWRELVAPILDQMCLLPVVVLCSTEPPNQPHFNGFTFVQSQDWSAFLERMQMIQPRAFAEPPGPVCCSPQMRQLWTRVQQAATLNCTVLLEGETGSGKGLIARWIHKLSAASGPFVVADCASLKPELMESELFGYEKGAFTGATAQHSGKIETAHGGTFFLDEVSELGPAQGTLLRFLEDGTFERLGGTQTLQPQTRVIAASNKNLRELVSAGKFRRDLLYRLDVVRMRVPSLKNRRADIKPLVEQLLLELAQQQSRPAPVISQKVIEQLEDYSWPGNVRELRNVLSKAMLEAGGGNIDQLHFDFYAQEPGFVLGGVNFQLEWREFRDSVTRELERLYLVEHLKRCGGNVTMAARATGLTRTTVHRIIKRHGVSADLYRPGNWS